MDDKSTIPTPSQGGRPPTVRQVYALARTLLDQRGEPWPDSAAAASQLIGRLRGEPGE